MATNIYPPLVTDVFDDFGVDKYRIWNSIGIGSNPTPVPIPTAPLLAWQTDDNMPTIRGTAVPGTVVNIFDNTILIGTATAGPDWYWTFQVDSAQAAGIHTYWAKEPGAIGAANSYVTELVHVMTPVITSVTDSAAHLISNGASTNDVVPTISGTTQPYTLVEIFDNGIKIGEASPPESQQPSATFDAQSWAWSFTPTQPLSQNTTHVFTAMAHANWPGATLDSGTPSDAGYTIGVGVTPAQPALLAPVITSVVDDVGVNQGAVADGGQTNDTRPTLHGTSEPGTVVTVSDNGHVIGTATTGADWQWTFTPGADLAAGANTLSVSAARADGTGSVAAWYTHGLDVTPSLDAVLATAGLSAAPAATPAAAAPTVQAAYVSEAAHPAAVLPVHDLAY